MLYIIGLPRSGTNFVQYLMNVPALSAKIGRLVHKHSLLTEATSKELSAEPDATVLLVARHPVLWIESLLLRASHEFSTLYGVTVHRDPMSLSRIAAVYEKFYSGWLFGGGRFARVRFVQYERTLADNGIQMYSWLRNNGFSVDVVEKSLLHKLPESIEFSDRDVQKNIGFFTTLSPAEAEIIMSCFSEKFRNEIDYRLEQLCYENVKDTHYRDLLYQITDHPEIVHTNLPRYAAELPNIYPNSPISHLVAHVIDSNLDASGYSGHHLDNAISVLEQQLNTFPFGGDELFAIITQFELMAGPDVASRVADIIDKRILPLALVIRIRARLARARGRGLVAEFLLRLGSAIHPEERDLIVELCETLRTQGRLSEALRIANEALSMTPSDHWLRGTRASILIEMNRLAEAEADVRSAIQNIRDKEPSNTITLTIHIITLGWIVARRGKYEEAKKLIEELNGVFPDDPWAYSKLEEICELVGDVENASRFKDQSARLKKNDRRHKNTRQ